ncbi:MAG: hypothetical protein FWH12_02270 [Treponema sp.]|nr:hypothetical protein [Treponema sp.]
MKKKYNLVGQDGNAFALMGYTRKAMRECGFPKDEIQAVMDKAMTGDYYHLLRVLDEAIQECNKGGKHGISNAT